MLAHELFHSAKSDRAAQVAAKKMQAVEKKIKSMEQDGDQGKVPDRGSPQWSAEVRLDKQVYDFLVQSGLLGPNPPPIQTIAPYYADHLAHPEVPVHSFPVPGYDKPLD
jgi:hypothetical protein